MANHYFQRFSGKKSNAQKKEEIRQEKRKARAEKRAWFEAQKKRAQEQPGESSKARSKAASKKAGQPAASTAAPAPMPLNKYIAHCGVCSRRDAANLIKEGKVKVNNTVVTEPGYKVQPKDEVRLNGKVLTVQKELVYNKKLTNIVFMGMGEPLLNYKNVIKAIERITAPDGLGMSPRRITVSTAGVAKQIKQLGDDGVRFKLALSLHAANDKKRNEIMPINDTNNIKTLIEALNYFYKKTGNEITFEYILFKGFNDSLKDADELIKIYRQVPADLINIIEYNPIDQARFQKPDEQVTEAFMAYLEKNRVNARLRRSRGKDIDAACGQLANKEVLTH